MSKVSTVREGRLSDPPAAPLSEPEPRAAPALLFDAVLRPHRSLGPVGFWMIVGTFGLASFIMGTLFLIQGAWPVFGFYGLDVALVYWALKASNRQGLLFERLELTRDALVVRRVSPRGDETRWEFQPFWLRVDLTARTGGGNVIILRSHGRALEIGAFLAPEEKNTLTEALRAALAEARTPAFQGT